MALLKGKVAIVTGAGGGLGRQHALALAAQGVKVVVNDVGGARDGTGSGRAMADGVVEEIRRTGGEAAASYDSVAEPASAERIVRTALDAFGRLDILVNNAGILRDKTLIKMDDDMWRAVLSVHLDGTFYCGRAAARFMKEAGVKGRIINTTSIAGLKGNFGQSNYAAAKAGIAGLTRVWAEELGKHGITVNAIAPIARTRMTDDLETVPEEYKAELVSPMVIFLASDLAAEVNGRIFGIHGRQLFEYKTVATEGIRKDTDWTPEEIGRSLDKISAEAAPVPAAGDLNRERILKAFQLMAKAFTPEKAGGWKANFQYFIDGADDHTITVEDGKVTIRVGTHGTPTCKVRVSAATLADMIEGKTSGVKAFMAGKIKADNLQDMMKFSKVFDFDRARAAAEASGAVSEIDLESSFRRLPEIFLPDKASAWNGKFAFDVEGTKGWTVTIQNKTCAVSTGRDPAPTCLITGAPAVLADLFTGRLDLSRARSSGTIKATNPMALLKLVQFFDWKRPAPAAAPKREGLRPELAGKKYRASAVWIRPETIRQYAAATDDPNPRFREGMAVPPVFPVTLVNELFEQVLTDDHGGDLSRMVHGEQRIQFRRPLRPWDLLVPRAEIAGIEEKETGQILHVDQILYREGEPVVELRSSLFFRSGSSKKPVESGAELKGEFSRTVAVRADQPVRYAEASGDFNPIHIDPAAARAAGLPGIILQGLCTMAFAGQAVVEEALGGDATRLEELSVRFRKPVLPGDRLTTRGAFLDRTMLSFVTVNQDGVEVIANGQARVHPPA
ncbi:MAG: SDR family NAD(P)-dependent oxidoreductase [Planctomycetes bacterium]|nr:SDR family NAD(P)-dependent oxidoreductase [Planctomycetota bacterium]